MNSMALYNRLPIFAQNAACTYMGRRFKRQRFSKSFWRLLHEYESRSGWNYDKLAEYRDDRVRKLVKYCYDTVPYYTKTFNEYGISPDSIRGLDDLKNLPIIDKQTVKDNYSDFISTAIPAKDRVWANTSGTTGGGFRFYTIAETTHEQWAVCWRYRRALGISFGMKCGVLADRAIVPPDTNKPPFYRTNYANNQIYLSAYHINAENAQHYVDTILQKEIYWIHGFPSIISALAHAMIDCGLSLTGHMKFITFAAENMLAHQEAAIRQAFGVSPFQHYANTEAVANFSQNKDRDILVDEDYCAVEFVPQDIGSAKVVGTCLTNPAMPFLRYDVKDLACVSDNLAGGRIVTSLDGRSEDYVVLANGAKIGRLDYVFRDAINIREAQIRQAKKGEITVAAVKREGFSSRDEDQLRQKLALALGREMKIDFEYMDALPRTKRGKLQFIVSEPGRIK